MPRQARKKSSTGMYHVMLRGADRKVLFSDDEDNLGFLKSLERAKKASGFRLYAYCLMGNHVHLLMEEGKEPLENAVKRLAVSYVYHYNEKYDMLGHLFQDRFRSEAIETYAYLMDVLRYICQNPVKAGLSSNLQDYRWLGCSGIKDDFGLTDDISQYTQLAGNDLVVFVNGECDEEHLEENGRKRMSDREAGQKLCDACHCKNVQEVGGWPEKKRNKAVRSGLSAGISIRQLARLTGISKGIIERIGKSN